MVPWLSQRGSVHLHQLLPLFRGGQRARVQRVITTQPTPEVDRGVTLIVAVGPRIRALAVRLTLAPGRSSGPGWREKLPARRPAPRAATPPRWLCTDIEAA